MQDETEPRDNAPGTALATVAESSIAPPVDHEIGLQVLERLAVGRSLAEIAEVPGMPSKETFLVWVMQSPALAQAYAKAREVSSYAMEDEALTLLRRMKENEVMTAPKAKALDLLVQQLRWSAEKRNPLTYSRQNNVNLQIPVQINTNLDLGDHKAGGGTSEFPNIYELTAETVVPAEEVEVEEKVRERKARVEKKNTLEKAAERRAKRAATVKAWRAKQREAKGGRNTQD